MQNENLNRIQRVSKSFKLLCSALLIITPLLPVFYWSFFNSLSLDFTDDLPIAINGPLPISTLLMACLVSFLPVSATVYGLWNLRKLFSLYQQAVVFTDKNANYLRKFGISLFFWVAANKIFSSLISVILSMNLAPGERMLVITINSEDIATLVIGAVIVLVSWVMKEAAILEDEIKHTV